jgi:hypothetical protein
MQAGLKQGRGRFRQGSTRSLKPIHASQAGLGSLLKHWWSQLKGCCPTSKFLEAQPFADRKSEIPWPTLEQEGLILSSHPAGAGTDAQMNDCLAPSTIMHAAISAHTPARKMPSSAQSIIAKRWGFDAA